MVSLEPQEDLLVVDLKGWLVGGDVFYKEGLVQLGALGKDCGA